jgi:MATE family multidrug resistance protein
MSQRRGSVAEEVRHVAQLAGPLVLAELGWMAMGVVDTVMLGRVSPEALGASSLAGVIFYTLAVFGTGLLLGMDTVVSQAFGAGDHEDCHRSLLDGYWFCLLASPVLMALMWASIPLLEGIGIHPAVLRETIPYMRALTWGMLPLLLYTALRRYLQAMDLVKPVMLAMISANLINAFLNWVLIWGNLGAPRMGAEGSGWSTTVSRVYMFAFLAVYAACHPRTRTPVGRADWRRMRRLISLGVPVAGQHSLEVGVFAAAGALVARLDPVSLAAHTIAINVVSVTFMVPMGISSAGAGRVGQALGCGDPRAAGRSGWIAVALGAAFMSCAALVLAGAPRLIARGFTSDGAVIDMTAALLAIGALFQLFDGIQGVATGALRGAGDTKTPMISHLLAYWVVGLPLGYFLCFGRGWGAAGLWAGLCLALILIGLTLLVVWHRTVTLLEARCVPQ